MFSASYCTIRAMRGIQLLKSFRYFSQYKNSNNLISRIINRNVHYVVDNLKGKLSARAEPATLANPLPNVVQSSKKRQTRRKLLLQEDKCKYNNVFAFATSDRYDMRRLKEGFLSYTLYESTEIEEFKSLSLLHVKTAPFNGESKEIYIFEEGSVVFWNMPEEECSNILKFIKQFELGSYNEMIIQNEQEVMHYTYSDEGRNSDLVNGLINLGRDKGEIQSALDKYTFSNAMVLSVKLGVWECILECYIADVKLLTDDLKLGKTIGISSKEVLKKTGELFSLRHAINLSSDALDVPDFYWDLETQEKIYIKMYKYFNINRRTTVVNEKIGHCLELLDLLGSQLNDKHHVRLEWMIIVLIAVEVVMAFTHGS